MYILTIRTDKPEAELGLYDDDSQINYETWEAHRQLAETIHLKIDELLKKSGMTLARLDAILIFKGPGSFTGLRIGFSVANAFASSLDKPILASEGDDWLLVGITKLREGIHDEMALPEYGALPNITKPRK
jgi:tRNA threonylcarbamoyladenosine biosynthesis protein TsaB